MTAHTSMPHVRVDKEIKEQAIQALTALGPSTSNNGRLFLRRGAIDKAFPLKLNVPTGQTVFPWMSCARTANRRARFATSNPLFTDLEKNSGQ